jgi:hypothetical protein
MESFKRLEKHPNSLYNRRTTEISFFLFNQEFQFKSAFLDGTLVKALLIHACAGFAPMFFCIPLAKFFFTQRSNSVQRNLWEIYFLATQTAYVQSTGF